MSTGLHGDSRALPSWTPSGISEPSTPTAAAHVLVDRTPMLFGRCAPARRRRWGSHGRTGRRHLAILLNGESADVLGGNAARQLLDKDIRASPTPRGRSEAESVSMRHSARSIPAAHATSATPGSSRSFGLGRRERPPYPLWHSRVRAHLSDALRHALLSTDPENQSLMG